MTTRMRFDWRQRTGGAGFAVYDRQAGEAVFFTTDKAAARDMRDYLHDWDVRETGKGETTQDYWRRLACVARDLIRRTGRTTGLGSAHLEALTRCPRHMRVLDI